MINIEDIKKFEEMYNIFIKKIEEYKKDPEKQKDVVEIVTILIEGIVISQKIEEFREHYDSYGSAFFQELNNKNYKKFLKIEE